MPERHIDPEKLGSGLERLKVFWGDVAASAREAPGALQRMGLGLDQAAKLEVMVRFCEDHPQNTTAYELAEELNELFADITTVGDEPTPVINDRTDTLYHSFLKNTSAHP